MMLQSLILLGATALVGAEFRSRLWPRLFCGPSADLRLTPFQVKKLMRARSAFLTEEVGMMNESASVIGCQSG